ncbi:hypothetical protein Nepgr_000415 [Nepenthes gracilis]|uniref:Uncharacterized protein n=1 Tax=Nepenthes gracilis TaxID=150966 RepID=A0AAD3P342_NEPGR|nr:hypothetical protein Nepgr_000415 [Nepenthes gracilis]
MRSFLPFWLLTEVDGYKDGMPNLPASAATGLTRSFPLIVHCVLSKLLLRPTDSGPENMAASVRTQKEGRVETEGAAVRCIVHVLLYYSLLVTITSKKWGIKKEG